MSQARVCETSAGEMRQGAAERVESLLHAFADGGLVLRLGTLPADFAQARAEHGGRSDGGGSEGEDHDGDGEEDEDREDKGTT